MTRVSPVVAPLLALALAGVACDFQHSRTVTAPTSVTDAGTASGAGSLVGVWSSGGGGTSAGSLPTPKECSNFQWSITSQSSDSLSGTFSAECFGAISLSGTASGHLQGTTIPLTVAGTANLPGLGSCAFTLTGTGYIENGDTLRIPYSGTTCAGPVSGEETLRRPSSSSPEPTPEPSAPPPAPAPNPGPSNPADELDLSSAIIVRGPSVASWPQTSTVTSTVAADHNLCIFHTKLGQWPSTIFFDDPNTVLEGNQWVFANINGQWYGGAADWYRPGQACKDVTPQTIARDAFYNDSEEPLRSWVPRVGETFGLMASTPARAWPAMRTLDERSNVVLVRWGQ